MGYVLSVLSTGACIWYGARNWNSDGEPRPEELQADLNWESKEEMMNEEL